MKPRLPEEVEAHDVELRREGILFVGESGAILAGFHGQDPQMFADGKKEPFDAGRNPGRLASRHAPWLQELMGAERSPGSFVNAGPITDAVNLGTVALRAGKKVVFDSETLTITNAADANRYLHREYREGWELPGTA